VTDSDVKKRESAVAKVPLAWVMVWSPAIWPA
jgi:hypothetical protein